MALVLTLCTAPALGTETPLAPDAHNHTLVLHRYPVGRENICKINSFSSSCQRICAFCTTVSGKSNISIAFLKTGINEADNGSIRGWPVDAEAVRSPGLLLY